MIVKIALIQKNPGNSNSEGKRKTVRVSRVDCKIQFAMLKFIFTDFLALKSIVMYKFLSTETVTWLVFFL